MELHTCDRHRVNALPPFDHLCTAFRLRAPCTQIARISQFRFLSFFLSFFLSLIAAVYLSRPWRPCVRQRLFRPLPFFSSHLSSAQLLPLPPFAPLLSPSISSHLISSHLCFLSVSIHLSQVSCLSRSLFRGRFLLCVCIISGLSLHPRHRLCFTQALTSAGYESESDRIRIRILWSKDSVYQRIRILKPGSGSGCRGQFSQIDQYFWEI
jgi:hypothetical protein